MLPSCHKALKSLQGLFRRLSLARKELQTAQDLEDRLGTDGIEGGQARTTCQANSHGMQGTNWNPYSIKAPLQLVQS